MNNKIYSTLWVLDSRKQVSSTNQQWCMLASLARIGKDDHPNNLCAVL